MGDCDFVHSQARARPAAIVLQLPLSHPFFRLTPLEFVSWFRFQFRIPQLARIANANAEGVEQCIAGCRDRNRNVDLGSTATTRTPASARPRCVAEAIAIGA